MDPLVFEDIALIEVPVTLGTKKCLLREASAEAANRYRTNVQKGMRMSNDTKMFEFGGGGEAIPQLLSDCLYEQYADNAGKPLERRIIVLEIQRLPDRVQEALFAKLKEITPSLVAKKADLKELEKDKLDLEKRIEELSSEEDTVSKNSHSAMMAGSV
jgi:hypothetical protein